MRRACLLPLLALVVGCSNINATNSYNHGVRAYDDGQFDAAASFFSRASQGVDNPLLSYNAAVARWQQAMSDDAAYDEAYKEVSKALGLANLPPSHRTKLLYVGGDLLEAPSGDVSKTATTTQTNFRPLFAIGQ